MRRLMTALMCVASAGVFASAQVMPNPQDWEAAMVAAEKAANKPGDEALSCDALQAELLAKVNDPALQAYVAKAGGEAQQRLEAVNKAQAGAAASAQALIAAQMAASVYPSVGLAALSAPQALTQAQQAQSAQYIQLMTQQTGVFMKVLPHIMRLQRVLQLAAVRKCDWLLKDVRAR